jgi:uncharacterized protein (DUF1697 family)
VSKAFKYVAFLRGINVGGHVLIKMAELKKIFANMGYENIRTILASGNVIFESEQKDINRITSEIESELKKIFNKEISVILRSMDELKKLESSEPFKNIAVTPDIRLYVTFLPNKTKPSIIKIPYSTETNEFSIISVTSSEIISVLDLSKGKGTTDAMAILEKEFGKNITTRNWKTILKIMNYEL